MDDGGGIELRAANGAAPSAARDDDDDFAAAAPASCAARACQYLTRCCRRRRSQRWSPLGQVDFDPAAAALARPKKKRSHRWKAPGASQFAKYAAKTPRREAYAHRSESDERAVANPLRPENRAIGRVERPSGRCYGLREQRDRQRAASSKIVEKRSSSLGARTIRLSRARIPQVQDDGTRRLQLSPVMEVFVYDLGDDDARKGAEGVSVRENRERLRVLRAVAGDDWQDLDTAAVDRILGDGAPRACAPPLANRKPAFRMNKPRQYVARPRPASAPVP